MNCSKHRSARHIVSGALLVGVIILSSPAPVLAGPVDDVKAQGLVGERADGLLGAVSSSSDSAIAQLVSKINNERMARYRDIAAQNGTSVQAVQAIAGRKLMEKAPSGQYINQGSGWVKK